MTTQTPATAEIEKWLRVWFFQIFDSGSERKTQNPAGVDSGSGPTSGDFPLDHVDSSEMFSNTVLYLAENWMRDSALLSFETENWKCWLLKYMN